MRSRGRFVGKQFLESISAALHCLLLCKGRLKFRKSGKRRERGLIDRQVRLGKGRSAGVVKWRLQYILVFGKYVRSIPKTEAR